MLSDLIQRLSERAVTSKEEDSLSALRELRSALRAHISGVKQMAAHAILRASNPTPAQNRKSIKPAPSRFAPHRHEDRHQRSLLMAGMILTELLYADRQMQERNASPRQPSEGEGSFTTQAD